MILLTSNTMFLVLRSLTPTHLKRDLVMRRDHSKVDVYYVTPAGKRLKSLSEAAQFFEENPEFRHLSVADFSFTSSKVVEDTISDCVERKGSSVKDLVLG
ncbi:hypothetical protein LIER_13773 [Lithospermum erythrorhizon]|uniref:MBD domain-containing protein n=1 Tax=Lithospermum erythrorhizon TaxID=34254 RepID=A0AAV3PYV8_LITER